MLMPRGRAEMVAMKLGDEIFAFGLGKSFGQLHKPEDFAASQPED